MSKLKYLSLFSGIGAFEKALTNLNIEYDLVGFSEIDKEAITSYCAVHNVDESKNLGDISKVNTDNIQADLITYGFPCFVAGTLVLTNNGYKKIEDVKENDYVLSHTNKFQKVVKTMINKTKDIYIVKTMSSESLKVTEEHPFYVRKKYFKWDNKKRKNNRLFENPEWIKTKDLSKNYYVGCAINTIEELPTWNGIEYIGEYGHLKKVNKLNRLFINNEFWWFVGRYIGDGWTRDYTYDETKLSRKKHDERVILCCNKNEYLEIENNLQKLNFNFSKVAENNIYKYHIVNKELTNFLYQFGKYAYGKHLTNTVLNLPIDLLKSFLIGYESADGYIDKFNLHRISSVSNTLIYDIAQCIMKVYKRPVSIYKSVRNNKHIIEGRVVNQLPMYSLHYKINKNKQDKAFYEDGYIWCPINNIKQEKYDGLVYNFEVENDNSYVVQNIIVHNCTDISTAGKQAGLKKDSGTRSSLLWEALRIIEDVKPKYAIAENVKNLVSNKFIEDFYELLKVLEKFGYNNYYKVLNANDFGIPQNRDRIFVISIRKDIDNGNFQFDNGIEHNLSLNNFLEKTIDIKYVLNDKTNIMLERIKDKSQEFQAEKGYVFNKDNKAIFYKYPGIEKKLIKLCNVNPSNNGQSGQVFRSSGLCPTLTTFGSGYIYREDIKKVTKITELEMWKLMGFTVDDYNKAEQAQLNNSNGKSKKLSKLEKQAGNSIVVPVAQSILKNLFI